MKSKKELFFGGVPTSPDVDRLMQMAAGLKDGDMLAYGDIEALINESRSTPRFRTICNRFKLRMFRERNHVLKAVPNDGYKILPPDERIGYSSSRVVQGFRRIKFGAGVARTTDRRKLTEEDRKTLDHLGSIDATIRLAEATKAKTLELPDPVKA